MPANRHEREAIDRADQTEDGEVFVSLRPADDMATDKSADSVANYYGNNARASLGDGLSSCNLKVNWNPVKQLE